MREKKDFFEKIKPFDKDEYVHIDNDRLIIFSVDYLEKNKIESSFENVVISGFKLFPERFSLLGFKQYPDAKRIHDCLFHCTYKTKQWLYGNAKSGYFPTDKGRNILIETNKRLTGEIINKSYTGTNVNRKEKFFLDLLKKDPAYINFISSDISENINEKDIRRILRVSSNTSETIIKENFQRYKKYSNKLSDENITKFLKYLESKWKNLES